MNKYLHSKKKKNPPLEKNTTKTKTKQTKNRTKINNKQQINKIK